jgi:proton-coupled amino acid transporter
MVLPLEAEAADKRRFGATLALSLAFIAVMYGLFGAMGYLAFGSATRDIITTNLGTGWLSILVQLGLCINLFFAMPVSMNPVYEVAERLLCGRRYAWWLRWILVVAVGLLAMLVPNFADFTRSSAVASASCSCSCCPPPSTSRSLALRSGGPGSSPTWPSLLSGLRSRCPGHGRRSYKSSVLPTCKHRHRHSDMHYVLLNSLVTMPC